MNKNIPAKSAADLSLKELVKWLTGITKPVHLPLLFSALMRIINICLDITLFALAAVFTLEMAVYGQWSWVKVGILVTLALIKATAGYLEQFSGHYVAFKALELLRTVVFSRLWPKAPQVMNTSRSGDLLASLTRDIDRIEVVYAHTFAPVVAALVVPAIMFPIAYTQSGLKILLIPALCVLISQFIVPFIGIKSAFKATAAELGIRRDLAHHVTDTIGGYYEILGYARVEQRLAEMRNLDREIGVQANRSRRILAVRRSANIALMLIALISILVVGINAGYYPFVIAGLLGGALRIFESPRGIEDATGYLNYSLAAARRLWDICHLPQPVADGEVELKATDNYQICFQNVSFNYGGIDSERRSFGVRNINIELPEGSYTVLVGSSGSGKSTLAKMLLRYFDATEGKILLGGRDIRDYTLDSLRKNVVMVAQKNQLLKATIADNLQLGTGAVAESELWKVLKVVELSEEIKRIPTALETVIDEKADNLSGGQIQRICLARALIMNPKVLVLDEFTASLNPDLEKRIRENMEREYSDLTILEITHQLHDYLHADRVLKIIDGALL